MKSGLGLLSNFLELNNDVLPLQNRPRRALENYAKRLAIFLGIASGNYIIFLFFIGICKIQFPVIQALLWLIIALAILLSLQRSLHREIQAIFLIGTRSPGLTVLVFSIIFLPGVFLHELSHLLSAKLLGVRTGKFSLLPTPLPDGRLQLGYVEAARADLVRDSLVGLAPLVAGIIIIAYVAVYQMQLLPLWNFVLDGRWEAFWSALKVLATLPGFWWWFYLIFGVGSTMMPSESDRHAWLPLILVAIVLFIVAILAGAGPWMAEHLGPAVNTFLRALSLVLGLVCLIHAILIVPLSLLHRLATKLTGLDIG